MFFPFQGAYAFLVICFFFEHGTVTQKKSQTASSAWICESASIAVIFLIAANIKET
jgi:hypothetical protein